MREERMERLLREVLFEEVPQIPKLQQKTRQRLAGVKTDVKEDINRGLKKLRPVATIAIALVLVIMSFISTLTLVNWGSGNDLVSHPEIISAQQQLPYEIVLPAWLPDGFELTMVQVDGTDLTLTFGNGKTQFEIFQSRTSQDLSIYGVIDRQDEYSVLNLYRILTDEPIELTGWDDFMVMWVIEAVHPAHYVYYSSLDHEISALHRIAIGSSMLYPAWYLPNRFYSASISIRMTDERSAWPLMVSHDFALEDNEHIETFRDFIKSWEWDLGWYPSYLRLELPFAEQPLLKSQPPTRFEAMGLYAASGKGLKISRGLLFTTYSLDLTIETANLAGFEQLEDEVLKFSLITPRISSHNADKSWGDMVEWNLVQGEEVHLRARGWYYNYRIEPFYFIVMLFLSLIIYWVVYIIRFKPKT